MYKIHLWLYVYLFKSLYFFFLVQEEKKDTEVCMRNKK